MARRQSQGTCYLCKGQFPKASITRHLTKCLTAHDEEAGGKGKAKKGKLVHVVVEGKYDPRYWLHLEMPATTQLGVLDGFLRDIWLECCGHLSAFKIEGKKRPSRHQLLSDLMSGNFGDDWRDPDEVDMDTPVGEVFEKGAKVSYDYDFGSTTSLTLKGVGEREGLVSKKNDVRLLARNDAPHIPCGVCGKAEATVIDMENSYDESGWLCEACAEKEGVDPEEMSLPVVNSPRTGVCGYTGN